MGSDSEHITIRSGDAFDTLLHGHITLTLLMLGQIQAKVH